jgi:hypothetical protein
MSLSINPPHPRSSVTLPVNKYRMQFTPCTGYETQARDVGHFFSRDTRHKSTGYETQMHGIRGTHNGIRGTDFTGYGARYSRDTRHGFDGIRGTRKIIKKAWSPYTVCV